MRKFTFILVLMAALLAGSQAWTAEVGTAQYYLEQGNANLEADNPDQAITDYSRALEINPRLAEAYNNRGNAYDRKGQYDQALADYNSALKIDPRYTEASVNRGYVALDYIKRGNDYLGKKQYDQAISEYSRSLKITPGDGMAYNNRAFALYFKKAYGQAWEDVGKAQSLDYKVNPKFIEDLRKASGREK